MNESIRELIPHTKIRSPRPTDTTIRAEVWGNIVPLTELSSGEVRLITMAVDYLEQEISNGIILMDEPSSHLHYDLQIKLIPFIQDLIKTSGNINIQLFITTHNPPIINSVQNESIYVVNLEDKENAISQYDPEDANINSIIQLIGLYNIQDSKHTIYVEGPTDKDFLFKLISKHRPNLLRSIRLIPKNGVQNLETFIGLLDKFRDFTDENDLYALQSHLSNIYCILDGDNSRKQQDYDRHFVWNFYHLENIVFQDQWLNDLQDQMEVIAGAVSKVGDVLNESIKNLLS